MISTENFNRASGTDVEAFLLESAQKLGLGSWGELARLLKVTRVTLREWRYRNKLNWIQAFHFKGATGIEVPAELVGGEDDGA